MPAQASRDTTKRYLELLKLIPRGGSGMAAGALKMRLSDLGYSVSERQVQRDLLDLSEIFPTLERNDRNKPFVWCWSAGSEVVLSGMSEPEALSLRIVENNLRGLLPDSLWQVLAPRFETARKELAQAGKKWKLASLQQKVRSVPAWQPLRPPTIDGKVQEVVQQGLIEEKQLAVEYRALGAETARSLRLHPLLWAQRGPVAYLAARAWDYEDVRLYALHRIEQARLLADSCQPPAGFSIDAYLRSNALQFGDGGRLRLEARIAADWLALILTETPLGEDQRIEDDRLSVTVDDTLQLRWWLLSQGPAIEVLAPAELRQEIADSLREAAALY